MHNIIDNAIVADDTDELNDLLPRIDFTHVNSVTVDGLTGADTYFRIDKITNESNGTTALRLVLVNKKTGETRISGTTIYSNNVKWKIESISFSGANKRSAVRIVVHGYRNGEVVNVLGKAFDGGASNVGGTSFGENESKAKIIVLSDIRTTEYSAWVHSLNFIDKETNINTWVDWHLVPMSRPLVNAPAMKTNIIDLPGADGQIDLSTVVSGKPVYSNRTGTWEFMVQNGWKPNLEFPYDTQSWVTMFSHIMNTLDGKVMSVILDDEMIPDSEICLYYTPSWYYKGRIAINNWNTGDHYSTITLSYDLEPYKRAWTDSTIKSL